MKRNILKNNWRLDIWLHGLDGEIPGHESWITALEEGEAVCLSVLIEYTTDDRLNEYFSSDSESWVVGVFTDLDILKKTEKELWAKIRAHICAYEEAHEEDCTSVKVYEEKVRLNENLNPDFD